jgi:hypothetical protein
VPSASLITHHTLQLLLFALSKQMSDMVEQLTPTFYPELELNQLILTVGFLLQTFDSDYISF